MAARSPRCYTCGHVPVRPHQCGACRTAVYCDAACQAHAWEHLDHRAWCTRYQQEARRAQIGGKRAREPAPGDDELDEARRRARMRRASPPAAPRPVATLPTAQLDGLPNEMLMAILREAPRRELLESTARVSEQLRAIAGQILLDRELARAGPHVAAAFAATIKPAHAGDSMAQYLALLRWAAQELGRAFIGLTLHFFFTRPGLPGDIRQDDVALMRRAADAGETPETLMSVGVVDIEDYAIHTGDRNADTSPYAFDVLPLVDDVYDGGSRELRRGLTTLAEALAPQAMLGASHVADVTTAFVQHLAAYAPEGAVPDLREWDLYETLHTMGYEMMLVHTAAVAIYPFLYDGGADAVYVVATPDESRPQESDFTNSFAWFHRLVRAYATAPTRELMGWPVVNFPEQAYDDVDDDDDDAPEVRAIQFSWASDLRYSVVPR